MTGRGGDLGVRLSLPVVDQHKVREHGPAEPVSQLKVQRQHEIASFAGEVLAELASYLIKTTRSP